MRSFFTLMNFIMSEDIDVFASLKEIIQPLELAQNLIKIIYERPILEASARDEDVVLSGIFEFTYLFLMKY